MVLSMLLACGADGQGGVDAQSRAARADSVRRAARAVKSGPARAPITAAPRAPAGSTPAATKRVATTRAATTGATITRAARARVPVAAPTAVPVSGRSAGTGAAAGGAVPASVPVVEAAPAPAAPVVALPTAPVDTAGAAPAPAAAASATSVASPARSVAPRRLSATQVDSVRARYAVIEPVVWVASPLARRVSPGMGFASPSGYGPAWGDVFVSASYQQRTRYTTLKDGAFGLGVGLGDPISNIGGELVYASFGSIRSGPFSNGTISARAHRIVRGYGISIGMENLAEVGRTTSAGPDGGRSLFVAVSQLRRLGDAGDALDETTPLGQEVLWTLGLGNGRFRRESDVAAKRETVNLFASVGYRFMERAAGILDLTGQDLTVALSVSPFRCVPLVISPGLADITGSAGDGVRFVLALGMTTRFDRDAFFRRPCSP